MRTAIFSVLASTILPLLVGAHEVRPAYLELKEIAPGEFEVLWKVPAKGGIPLAGDEPQRAPRAPIETAENASRIMPCGCPAPSAADLGGGTLPIHPAFPKGFVLTGLPRVERIPGAELRWWRLGAAPESVENAEITVHGLQATMADVLVRVSLVDGRTWKKLLRPDEPSFRLDGGTRLADFFVIGIEHILLGPDHLLFVLGLMLIVQSPWMLIKTVTAFTLAHSLTLGAVTLGYARAPTAAVEATIALSIFFLAPEIVRTWRGQTSFTIRHPWVVAFGFGLLHGFGFAGALSEIGLPQDEIALSLLLFNLGVECGQLLFVALLFPILLWLRQACEVSEPLTLLRWARLAPGYLVGFLGAYWTIERVTEFLTA